jgi:hypothetical protein
MEDANSQESNVEDKTENTENKSEASSNKKNELLNLTTRPISDEDMRNQLNKEFGRNNQYYAVLKEAVDNLTNNYKKNMKDIITLIKDGIRPDYKTDKEGNVKSIDFKRKLTNEELENFAVSIPVELFYLQEYMDDKALDMEMSEQLKEFNITEKILEIHGGTEKERTRAAEYKSMISIFTSIIKNRVYFNLKNESDQATKVYDAIKRVIQLRITELQTFGKSDSNYSPQNSHTGSNNTEYNNQEPYICVNSELADYMIVTNKYGDGITVQDLFFKDQNYFNWIKDKEDVSGDFMEYQAVIKDFYKEFTSANPRYKVG